MSVEILKILNLSSAVIGLFISIMLFARSYQNQGGSRTLACFLLCLLVYPMLGYCYMIMKSPPLILEIAGHCLILLYGPFVYLLIKQLLNEKLEKWQQYIHGLPFLGLFSLKYSGVDTQTWYLYFVFFTLILGYSAFNIFKLYQASDDIKRLHTEYKNTTFYWLSFIVYGIFALTLLDIIIIGMWYFELNQLDVVWEFMSIMLCLYLLAIAGFSIWRPEIFFSKQSHDPIELTTNDVQEHKEKRRELELSETLAAQLKSELNLLMQKKQVFLDNKVTLSSLSSLLSISTNQLSELLNVHMQTSFYGYVNQLRLNYVLDRLNDPKCSLPALDIAYQAGFNRNTFYKVFKAELKMTPSQYKKQVDKFDLATS
ncbi:AraC family transcriptional regulator [Catenovulum sp. SM1970]|uniref:helix-turn-helix domain-containing protein n=1 Tax=Marinifaba aquimaris TaxID=2741323 RepID=UPI001573295A|nr:helix-turn-helix domain-containing protein [Marinifaba aquimaris]NTS77325.1 AraC family transcriptional regulator [Marinifaba aquimaris]